MQFSAHTRIAKDKYAVNKGLAKLQNILAKTLFLVMFPWVAILAGNKQNVLLPQWQNEETLSARTKKLRMRAMIN